MRQKKQRDEGGGASWMDTYGDLVTLLLCFFVMLFASSTMNEEKWIAIIESFRGNPSGSVIEAIDIAAPTQGFSDADMISQTDPNEAENEDQAMMDQEELDQQNKSEEQEEIDEEFNALYEQLNVYVSDHGLNNQLLLTKDGMYITITILEGVLFESAEATIRDDEARQVLEDIGSMTASHMDSIEKITIEGHTDNRPISNAAFEDNFDLGAKRASNVMRYINEINGIDFSYFYIGTPAEFSPIADNDTQEGKQKNRRVTLVLLSRNVDILEEQINQAEMAFSRVPEETGAILATESTRIVQEAQSAQAGAQ